MEFSYPSTNSPTPRILWLEPMTGVDGSDGMIGINLNYLDQEEERALLKEAFEKGMRYIRTKPDSVGHLMKKGIRKYFHHNVTGLVEKGEDEMEVIRLWTEFDGQ